MQIRLFISDIDGCLAEPYHPYDLDRFSQLAAWIEEAGLPQDTRTMPAFSICSGRAYPYVEALTQALGVQVPVLFEAGGGLFDPRTAQVTWHPAFRPEVEAAIGAVKAWLIDTIVPGTAFIYDYGKRTQAGVIGPNAEEVEAKVPIVEAYVAEHHPALRVFHTSVSIDVLSAEITKRQGVHWLAEHVNVPLDAMAYLGDTGGDLEALGEVGFSFAPANGTDAVKERVLTVTQGAGIEGVLEAYSWCCAHNRSVQPDAAPIPS